MKTTTRRVWLDYEKAAAHLGVTIRQLRRWVENRSVPFTKLGAYVRFDPEELDRWLEAQTSRPESTEEA